MLEVNGIDTIFCLPGVQNDPFFDALYDRNQRHQADPCAPRAGLRVHGAGLRHGDGIAVGLRRRARPRLPQHHGGAVDSLRGERAGAGADRPDPAGDDRPQSRPAARTARPARDHARPSPSGPTASPRPPPRPAWSTKPSVACCPGGGARWRWSARWTPGPARRRSS